MSPENAIEELNLIIFSLKNVSKLLSETDKASLLHAPDSALAKVEQAIYNLQEEYDLD